MLVTKKGRILMLLGNNNYPADKRVEREAVALIDEGFDVSVIAPRGPKESRTEVISGVKVHRYPPPAEHDSVIGFAWEFLYSTLAMFFVSLRIWRQEGFDVVHSHNPPDTFFLVGFFYKLFGKKYVFDHHDVSSDLYMARSGRERSNIIHKILMLLERLTFMVADRVISTNQSIKEVAMERGRVPADKVYIVRNGSPLSEIVDVEPMPEIVENDRVLFGYAGEISYQDGLHFLVEGLAHLKHHLGRTDFFCYVMGDGDDLPRIKQLAVDKKIDDHILFTGWIKYEELGRYLSSIDIGLDPDPSNPFNDRCTMIKITEYMAFGKPIVAFDLPEHRRTAKDAAVYVPDNDPKQFAQALQMMMDDPQRRAQMGAFGRARVENEIAWDYSIPHLVNAYHDLLGLPARPVTPDLNMEYKSV